MIEVISCEATQMKRYFRLLFRKKQDCSLSTCYSGSFFFFFDNIMTPGGVLEHCNLGGSERQEYIDNFDRNKHIHICVWSEKCHSYTFSDTHLSLV